MKWALVDSNDMVVNVIVYNGSDPYLPPEGLILKEVNNWVDKGMKSDIAERDVPKPIPDPVKQKQQRNLHYKNDLSMVAMFDLAKKTNPTLQFSDYLDTLENMKDNVLGEINNG